MRRINETIISGQAATANPFSGPAIDMREFYAMTSIIRSSSGSNAGTLKLQGSNDQDASNMPNFAPTNWVDIPSKSVTVTAGAIAVIEAVQLCYAYVRHVWTPSAGAGTIAVDINKQGF